MSNVVYIINIASDKKPGRSEPYKYGVMSWKNWCDKNDAKLVVLDEAILPYDDLRPNWHKVFIFDLLRDAGITPNKILIVDADTIIHPDTPNFFEREKGTFSVVSNIGSYEWVFRSVENYRDNVFDGFDFDMTKYFNSGFMLFDDSHEGFFKDVKDFYFENKEKLIHMQETFGTGTDQPVLNFLCQIKNIDLQFLPYTYNMQDLNGRCGLDDGLPFVDLGYIYHFNAIPNNPESVMHWMKATYTKLYT
jgi:lipopolysaccharide biosynthesis glycosyltransferase